MATHPYRWLEAVPSRDGKDASIVDGLVLATDDPAGQTTYRNSFVTHLPANRDNVAEFAALGRARRQIENESFGTLKTKG